MNTSACIQHSRPLNRPVYTLVIF